VASGAFSGVGLAIEIAELVLAEVDESTDAVSGERSRSAEQYLVAMGGGHDAGGTVHRRSETVSVALDRFAGVEPIRTRSLKGGGQDSCEPPQSVSDVNL
jgi:hypothetical protein